MSETDILHVSFESQFAPSYLRNNRTSGQKSMRCFPSCCPTGHFSGGKCGVPLEVRAALKPCKYKHADLIFVAEIRPLTTPQLSALSRIAKGTLFDKMRSPGAPEDAELFLGISHIVSSTKDKTYMKVIFNSQNYSWDYSWKSCRWNSNTEHVVDIVILRSISHLEYKVCSSHISTPFKITCSHKKRSHPDAAAVVKTTLASSSVQERILEELNNKFPLVKRSCFEYDVQHHVNTLLEVRKTVALNNYESSDSEDSKDFETTPVYLYSDDIIELPKCNRIDTSL